VSVTALRNPPVCSSSGFIIARISPSDWVPLRNFDPSIGGPNMEINHQKRLSGFFGLPFLPLP
jgi:hypothetical protein